MPIPAYCTNCQSIFPAPMAVSYGGVIDVQGTIKMQCPVCGSLDAEVSKGVFTAVEETVEVLSGPESTRVMVEALQAIAGRLRRGEISKSEAVKQAEAISPRFASILDHCAKFGIPGLALLVATITLYLQYESNQSSGADAKKLLDAVTQQTLVIKDVGNKQRIQNQSDRASEEKVKGKAPVLKNKSARRVVNQKRRDALRKRRAEFGSSRHH